MQFAQLYHALDFSSTEVYDAKRCPFHATSATYKDWPPLSSQQQPPHPLLSTFITLPNGETRNNFWKHNAETYDRQLGERLGLLPLVSGANLPIYWNHEWITKHNTAVTSTVIVRKELVLKAQGGFDESMRHNQRS